MPININGSTGISGVDGSAGTPALQGSDTNTGVRFGTDIVSLVTGGSDRLYIDSSGRLGVGTTAPGDYDVGANKFVISDSTNSGITIRGGTTGQGAIYFADGTTGNEAYRGRIEYSHSSDSLNFGTAGTGSRVTLDSSGRLGIGTTAPQVPLDLIADASGYGIALRGRSADGLGQLRFTSNNYGTIYSELISTSSALAVNVNSSERARIDSSGRLLVGYSSAVSDMKYGGSGGFGSRSYVYGANDGFANGIAVLNYDATATVPALLKLCSSRNDTPGNNTAVGNSGDKCAAIQFMGNDGTQFIDLARIDAETDGTVGTNDMPGRLMFNVTRDGGSVVTERMRISRDGDVRTFGDTWGFYSLSAASAGTSYAIYTGRYNATGVNDGTNSFVVYTNGNVQNTNGSYTQLSDVKLKENIVDASSQWDDLKAVRIRNWNFKEETGLQTFRQIGPIAQELEQVCPGLVFESPDRDAEGNDLGTTTKGVNQSILYMKAVKALQEAMERIETLEAANAALEARLTALEGGN